MLLEQPDKHLVLAALRFLRQCIGVNEIFYNRLIVKKELFVSPLLTVIGKLVVRPSLGFCLHLPFLLQNCRRGLPSWQVPMRPPLPLLPRIQGYLAHKKKHPPLGPP